MYTQVSLLLHETMVVRSHMLSARAGRNPSRGHRRRNRRRMPSCTSRRTWAKRREARAAVGAVRILGAGAAVVVSLERSARSKNGCGTVYVSWLHERVQNNRYRYGIFCVLVCASTVCPDSLTAQCTGTVPVKHTPRWRHFRRKRRLSQSFSGLTRS